MIYHDLIDRLAARYCEKPGIVKGEPVELLYVISRTAERQGYESEVDTALLIQRLTKAGVRPQLIRDALNA